MNNAAIVSTEEMVGLVVLLSGGIDLTYMLYLQLIILSVGDDVPETLLVTDFVNIKIKLIQSFEGAHRDRMCAHIFI
jgi:hypothetical protein